ncbi:MAG: NAD(P)-dependent oxidoreductase [Chlamydiales bacterium]|nr:NAD(P)-dependent oxidoreductase [Chlamydiales bacterium]
MSKQIILITGISGRIGLKVAEYFFQDYQVVGFDRTPPVNQSLDFIKVDISSDESVLKGFDQLKKKFGDTIVSVIHLAAYYSFAEPESKKYDQITVKGTQRLLKGLVHFQLEQFIFSSTMLVYKPTKPGVKITEDSAIAPSWGYPRSKIQTEQLIHELREGFSNVNLRIAGVYDDKCHSIPLSNQMQRIFEKQIAAHLFSGDVHCGSNFVHMSDLVEAIGLCVKKRKELPEEIHLLIGEAKTFSYDELQKKMAYSLYNKKEWKTWRIPKPIAKIGAWFQSHLPFMKPSFIKPWMIQIADDHYELDISKAKKYLGWEPKKCVYETILKWAEELKKDPLTWYTDNGLTIPNSLKK